MSIVAIGLFYLHHLKKKKLALKFKWKGNLKWKLRPLYLDGLQGAAEQHVVRRDQRAHRVVMGTYSVDFLQGLDVPHLPSSDRGWGGGGEEREERSTTTRRHWRDAQRRCRLALGAATHDDGAVCRAAVQPVPVDKGRKISRVSSGTAALPTCISWWCSGFALKRKKEKHSGTLVCTVPIRCHRDPQGSSDICRWCRCPTPKEEDKWIIETKEFRFRVEQQ